MIYILERIYNSATKESYPIAVFSTVEDVRTAKFELNRLRSSNKYKYYGMELDEFNPGEFMNRIKCIE